MDEQPALSEEEKQTKVRYYLTELNKSWKRYGDIEDGVIDIPNPLTRSRELRLARETYSYAELWLSHHGYPWHLLKYDAQTRSYSLPD